MKPFLATLLLISTSTLGQEVSTPDILQEVDLLINDYQFDQALLLMDRAPDSLDIALLRRKASCYSKLGNYPDAILTYEAIGEIDSVNREALYNLGQLYSNTEEYGKARSCYEKLVALDSTNSFYCRQYASVVVKDGDRSNGIALYLKTLKLNPRDLQAYAQLSNVLIEDEQYELVDGMLTGLLSTTESAQLTVLLARANLGEGKYQAVIDNVEPLMGKGDTTATYARLLGISYFQLDDYLKVIPFMEFLLKRGLRADWMFYYLGTSYQQVHNTEKGIEFLNLAVEEGISKNIGVYYTQLATAYEEIKDFKNAIRNYKMAYETSKADILLYHLARNYDVYYKDKRPAQIYYKRYLDSDDTIRLAKKYSQQRLDILSGGQ